jgi:hypothetical protein
MPNQPGARESATRRFHFAASRVAFCAAPFCNMNRLKVALILVCMACVEEAPLNPVPEQVIPTTISASDRDLQTGESTTLTVTITNTLDEEVELAFPTSCQALVFIRNAEGRVMVPANGTYLCADVPSLLILAAGASKVYNVTWGGGVEFGPAGSSTRLPAGSYFASAELRADNYIAIAFPITIVVR